MTTIRNYRTEDYEAVKQILQAGNLFWEVSDTKEALERKISEHPDSIIVAEVSGAVVGMQMINYDFMPLLFRGAVHPDHRGKGIITALIEEAEKRVKAKGYNNVNMLVLASNKELQEAFQRKGYEKGQQYVWMTKILK